MGDGVLKVSGWWEGEKKGWKKARERPNRGCDFSFCFFFFFQGPLPPFCFIKARLSQIAERGLLRVGPGRQPSTDDLAGFRGELLCTELY